MTLSEHEFDLLVLNLLENSLSDEQIQQVQDLLFSRPEYLTRYCDIVKTYAAVQIKFGSEIEMLNRSADTDEPFDASLWQALAEQERQAETVQFAPAAGIPELITGVRERKHQLKSTRPVSRLSLYTTLAGVAAVLLLVAYVMMNPRQMTQPTATILQTVQARWLDRGAVGAVGDRLHNTDAPLQLVEGFVQIRLDDGAEALIQAPARFRAENTNQLYLEFGKLASTVPPAARGFVVRTPAATVVDYGTEFGVLVDNTGRTEAHVFKGEVELRCGSDPIRHGVAQRLLSGLAGTVTAALEFSGPPVQGQQALFVRDTKQIKEAFQSGRRVDLADIVGGGNGFGSGTLGAGIDLTTGQPISQIRYAGRMTAGYTTVQSNPFVDGVFVPNGQNGPVQISSTGLTYEGFIATSGKFWHEPVNGGVQVLPTGEKTFLTLNGNVYGDGQRSTLNLHANLGLTFDLDRLRAAMPGRQVAGFSAVCGIPDQITSTYYSMVDFVILVDGRCIFRRDQVKARSGVIPVQIPLGPHDRFLTLAVTDGGNTHHQDSAMFAEPFIELMRE